MANATTPDEKPKATPTETIASALNDLTSPKSKVVDPAQVRRDEIEGQVNGEFVNFTQNLGLLLGDGVGDFTLISNEEQLAKALTALKSARNAVVKAVRGIDDDKLV